jgi:hypothetical protein
MNGSGLISGVQTVSCGVCWSEASKIYLKPNGTQIVHWRAHNFRVCWSKAIEVV